LPSEITPLLFETHSIIRSFCGFIVKFLLNGHAANWFPKVRKLCDRIDHRIIWLLQLVEEEHPPEKFNWLVGSGRWKGWSGVLFYLPLGRYLFFAVNRLFPLSKAFPIV
jgi:hypothetical protein